MAEKNDVPAESQDEAAQPTVEELAKKLAALEAKLDELDPRLTGRINALNTTVAGNKSELSKKVGAVEADLSTVKTTADNNAASIASFQNSIDSLTHKIGDAENASSTQRQRMETLETWQGAINTALSQGIQSAKDFALEQGTSATTHADNLSTALREQYARDKAELEQKIQQVADAPVKPHKHAVNVHVEAVTGEPVTVGGGNA